MNDTTPPTADTTDDDEIPALVPDEPIPFALPDDDGEASPEDLARIVRLARFALPFVPHVPSLTARADLYAAAALILRDDDEPLANHCGILASFLRQADEAQLRIPEILTRPAAPAKKQ